MSGPAKRILIVDDEADISILLRQVLVEASFDVDVASGGKEGLAKAMSTRYDLILLDMNMPDMDGTQVLKQLREYALTKDVPVIILTGSAWDVDVVVAALEFNPSDFITKVISPKELIARIHWTFRKLHSL